MKDTKQLEPLREPAAFLTPLGPLALHHNVHKALNPTGVPRGEVQLTDSFDNPRVTFQKWPLTIEHPLSVVRRPAWHKVTIPLSSLIDHWITNFEFARLMQIKRSSLAMDKADQYWIWINEEWSAILGSFPLPLI